MDNEINLDIDELNAIRKKICTLDQKHQQEELKKVSPYSEDITSHIQSCDELQFYVSLHLQESYNKLAQKYGFKPSNIYRILHIMTTETQAEYFKTKRRLTPTELHNRNKAIFIDFLRWSGERADFCRLAAKKYGLSFGHIETILKYCLYADSKRFNMV